jgi:hypothetical protein
MDVRGWVYVITNEAMPGLVKIGFSRKDPKLRAAELGGTGSPCPYVVEYDALLPQPQEVESRIHLALAHCRIQSQADTPVGTEWFRCSRDVAVEAIQRLTERTRLLESHRGGPGGRSVNPDEMSREQESFYEMALRARRALLSRGDSWTLAKRSLLLSHRQSARRFYPGEYTYDGSATIKGFAIKNRETPWVRLEDVEFVD